MEKIEVRYLPIPITGGLAYHKYIIYTDDNGDQFGARGGPTKGGKFSGIGPGGLEIEEGERFDPGPIVTEHGVYDDTFKDFVPEEDPPHPSETIAEAPDLSVEWNAITQEMDVIGAGDFMYLGVTANSNSVVDQVLEAAGLPAPQLDDFGENLSPGSDGDISIPYDIPGALAGWLEDALTPFLDALQALTPLVLDLDGDGVELTQFDAATTTTLFDIDADGFAEQTAWVMPDDGLLVRDLNGDGLITSSTELFGGSEVDGFAVLAGLDTNGDLVIDAADAGWNDLLAWKDVDGDAITDAGELQSLTSYNIASIDLAGVHVPDPGEGEPGEVAGNEISHVSSYTLADGTQKDIVDAWFVHDDVNSTYNGGFTLDIRTLFMPTLRGFGALPGLHIAMSRDETLLDLVAGFTTGWSIDRFADANALDTDIETILFTWAGVDGVDPASRGPNIDARRLEFMEVLFDEAFLQRGQYEDPFEQAAQLLEESWGRAYYQVKAHLIVQAGGSSLFDGPLAYNPATAELEGNLALSQAAVDDLEIRAGEPGVDAFMHWRSVAEFIQFTRGLDNLTAQEETWLGDAVAATTTGWTWEEIKTVAVPLWTGVVQSGSPDDETIYGTNGNDILDGHAGDDDIFGQDGDDLLRGGSEDDHLSGGAGADTLHGDEGDDELLGDQGNDLLFGGLGNDTLYGHTGDDTLHAGLGGDFVYGREGNDTYVYEGGNDVYEESFYGGADRIVLPAGIGLNDLGFHRLDTPGNGSLVIEVGTLGTVETMFFTNGGIVLGDRIETLQLADSSTYALESLLTSLVTYGSDEDDGIFGVNIAGHLSDTLYGLGGNDDLWGYDGADILDGGAGNDSLRGGLGDDVYIVSPGFDTVFEDGGFDVIHLPEGFDQDDVSFIRTDADPGGYDGLKILVSGLGEVLIRDQYRTVAGDDDRVERLAFFDGSFIDLYSLSVETRGDSGSNTLSGVTAGGGQDDILNPLGGDDFSNGGSGDDTYIYTSGLDQVSDTGGTDVIRLPVGVDAGNLAFANPLLRDVDIIIDPGVNEIKVLQQTDANTTHHVETLLFADHFSLDLGRYGSWVFGTPTGERIDGGYAADDIILLGDGDDTSYGKTGLDTLHGGAGADHLVGNEDDDQLHGGDDDDTVRGSEGDDTLFGGKGNDTLYGEHNSTDSYEGKDTLDGGAGNDILRGGLGDDTYIASPGLDYIYDRGGLDTLVLGAAVTPGGLSFMTDPLDANDLVVVINPGVDEITIENQESATTTTHIEQVRFADGFMADLARYDAWTFGTAAGERIDGTYGFDDITLLGDGDDTSYGKTGNDTAHGGAGADYLVGDEGDDNLHGGSGDDDVQGRDDNDLVQGGAGNDTVRGGDGDDTVLGNAGNDSLFGDHNNSDAYTGADTLDGGDGNDELRGGLGDDLYVASAGQDYVYDRGGVDTLQYGEGIRIGDLSFAVDVTDTNDLIIDLPGSGMQVHIENQLSSSSGVEIDILSFAGGAWASLANYGDWLFGSSSAETLAGSDSRDDTLVGYEGDDLLYGKDGLDELFGGDGDDYLRAGNDNDLLVGGTGDDDLRGDAGDDTLMAGAGADRLQGDAGADTFFLYGEEAVDGNLNRVVDFSVTDGDTIRLADVLSGYDPLQDSISDFITLAQTSHTYLNIDRDGTGGTYTAEQAVRIENIAGQWTDAADMMAQGDLVVV